MREILVLAGPSAVGKTTVADCLLESGDFISVRSVTTRERRGDAFDGEYIYLSREEFSALVAAGGVLEYTEYAGELYGTPSSEIERAHAAGKYPLLILDLNGVRSLSERADVRVAAVYIHSPLEALDARLRARYIKPDVGIEDNTRLSARMAKNREDYREIVKFSSHFWAFVENSGTPRDTAEKIKAAFFRFLSGAVRDEDAIDSAALALSREK